MSERKFISPVGDEGLYILNTADWRDYHPVINKEKCINCGICGTYCPVNDINRVGKEIMISYDFCKGCGICAEECPLKAIDMILGKGGEKHE